MTLTFFFSFFLPEEQLMAQEDRDKISERKCRSGVEGGKKEKGTKSSDSARATGSLTTRGKRTAAIRPRIRWTPLAHSRVVCTHSITLDLFFFFKPDQPGEQTNWRRSSRMARRHSPLPPHHWRPSPGAADACYAVWSLVVQGTSSRSMHPLP